MVRPGRPERNRTVRSFRQLRRFHHGFNSDEVFGTHTEKISPTDLAIQVHALRSPTANDWHVSSRARQATTPPLSRGSCPTGPLRDDCARGIDQTVVAPRLAA